jgi:FMN phosphatase YigB (HAD superfamily)
MTIACISFDWGDTLASNATMPYDLVQRRTIISLGHSLKRLGGLLPDDWRSHCQAQLGVHWRDSIDPRKNPDHKEFDYQALVEGWVTVTGVDLRAAEDAIASYFICCSEIIDPFGTVEPVLATLKASGYRLGICSHVAWPEHACQAWFVSNGWDRYLDFYSLSSTVGRIKPHPAHFGDLLAKAGCLAEEIAHVGDHPLRDVIGAQQAGMRTVLKATQDIYSEKLVNSCTPDAVIAHVNELPALLTTHPHFSDER